MKSDLFLTRKFEREISVKVRREESDYLYTKTDKSFTAVFLTQNLTSFSSLKDHQLSIFNHLSHIKLYALTQQLSAAENSFSIDISCSLILTASLANVHIQLKRSAAATYIFELRQSWCIDCIAHFTMLDEKEIYVWRLCLSESFLKSRLLTLNYFLSSSWSCVIIESYRNS